MKKILSLLLAFSLLFSLIGCKPAGQLNAPLQPELQVPTTEATEDVTTESTEWLVEWPTEAPTEEIETVPEKTQPPQEEEIIDSRPHPADIVEQDQQQDQYEQNGYQPENRPDTQQPGQGSAQIPAQTTPTDPAAPQPPYGSTYRSARHALSGPGRSLHLQKRCGAVYPPVPPSARQLHYQKPGRPAVR